MSRDNSHNEFDDFSLSNEDLYKDFLDRDEQIDSRSDEDILAEGKRKERLLLGHDSTPEYDDISSIEDEVSQDKNRKSHGDIESLMALVKKDRDYDISDDAANEDMLNALRRQKAASKHIFSSLSNIPDDIHLLDDPIDVEYDGSSAVAGDENILRAGNYVSAAIASVAVILMAISIYINVRPQEQVVAQSPETTQGTGDIINNAISDDDLTATVTSTMQIDSPSSAQSPSDSGKEEGASEDSIRYEIISEGGIKTASISYINSTGSRESETGVTLPWNKTVSNASSITPHIAANPGERGTLTCKIYKGNEKIAEDTAAGENASVECKA